MTSPFRRCLPGILLLPLLLSLSPAVAQTVYRWVDEQGRVTYQDQPPPEGMPATQIELKADGYYAWTDEQGRRHYSDRLPETLAPAARELASANATPPPAAADAAAATEDGPALPYRWFGMPALLLVAWAYFRWLHASLCLRLGAWRLRRWIARAGAVLHDILLPDGLGGRTRIDHLLKLPGGLLVIEVVPQAGRIFGEVRDADWVCERGRSARNFPNPIRLNKAHVAVVRMHAGPVPVSGTVVFPGGAGFPDGRPDGVIAPRELSSVLRHASTPPIDPRALDAAWQAVQQAGQVQG